MKIFHIILISISILQANSNPICMVKYDFSPSLRGTGLTENSFSIREVNSDLEFINLTFNKNHLSTLSKSKKVVSNIPKSEIAQLLSFFNSIFINTPNCLPAQKTLGFDQTQFAFIACDTLSCLTYSMDEFTEFNIHKDQLKFQLFQKNWKNILRKYKFK